ncbi:MAG: rhodanese-related sulfurtransferase [Pseudomonadota bacterium]
MLLTNRNTLQADQPRSAHKPQTAARRCGDQPTNACETVTLVAALYHFHTLPDADSKRSELAKLACSAGVKGILLLAREGINGTIAGAPDSIARVLAHIRAWPGFADIHVKYSETTGRPYTRLKVRIKAEIVTMGQPDIDAGENRGTYVPPEAWNALISRDDVMVIDTRNDYECEIGSFAGALNPKTSTFSDFPSWAQQHLAPPSAGQKAIAMYCTGGIRCEKSTAYLKSIGYEEVYHLHGGILNYLERIKEADSLWQGQCFVFDQRVSVGHGLADGPLQLCSICRNPFASGAGAGGYARHPCPSCQETAGMERLRNAEERQKQIQLARARGHEHLGDDAEQLAEPVNEKSREAEPSEA